LPALRPLRHAASQFQVGYPNLARGFVPTVVNQLWVADITCIRLEEEFVYLAVILDAYSRRVIGLALERTLQSSLGVPPRVAFQQCSLLFHQLLRFC
jgi:transposase InsO family protein